MKTLFASLLFILSMPILAQEGDMQRYQLKIGEQAVILSNTYEFLGITMDSRCPSDVTCVMAGWAIAEVKITQLGEAPNVKQIKIPAAIPSDANPKLLCMDDDRCIVAGELTPYPISTQKMEDREYCLELWVKTP